MSLLLYLFTGSVIELTNNYRRISLLPVSYKNYLIICILIPYAESFFQNKESVFRSGMSKWQYKYVNYYWISKSLWFCRICALRTTYWESRPLSKLLVWWYLEIYSKETVLSWETIKWISRPERSCKHVYPPVPSFWQYPWLASLGPWPFRQR
jgi:hypothetical protein